MKSKKSTQGKELSAGKRAEVILEVRGGGKTVAEAAVELGVSRKTYYQWEKKAFASMVKALKDKEPGRPALPSERNEVSRLRKFIDFQQDKIDRFKYRERLIRTAFELKISILKGRAEKKCSNRNTG